MMWGGGDGEEMVMLGWWDRGGDGRGGGGDGVVWMG